MIPDRRAIGEFALRALVLFVALVIVGSAAGYLVLTLNSGLDAAALNAAARGRTPSGLAIMRVISDLGSFALLGPLAAALVILRRLKRPWEDIVLIVIALGSAALPSLIKLIVHRARPTIGVLEHLSSLSFPSEHTTQAAAIYGAMAVILTRGWSERWRAVALGAALTIALLVAVSRVYLGDHYPSDVIAGLLLGWAWAWFTLEWAARGRVSAARSPSPGDRQGPGRTDESR